MTGYLLHRENKENWQGGKHREFGYFAKTQGILFAQVLDSLILKIRDIVILAAKFPKLASHTKLSLISKIPVGQGRNREKVGFEWTTLWNIE